MRKPRDFDSELKALTEKAKQLKSRKVLQLGELVIATGSRRARSRNADRRAARRGRKPRTPKNGRRGG